MIRLVKVLEETLGQEILCSTWIQITWSTLVIRKWQCRWIESSAPVSAGVEPEVVKEVVIVAGEDNQEEEGVECTADLDTPPLITGLAISSRLAGMTAAGEVDFETHNVGFKLKRILFVRHHNNSHPGG